MTDKDPRTIFVTGTAGFIGFHLARHLLDEGFTVVGFDGMTDYYDVALNRRRHQMLLQTPGFRAVEGRLEDSDLLKRTMTEAAPDVIVHLAAQAGVRYSLENPRSYVEANLVGTFNVMECARELAVDHLLMASTSSVYGANTQMPFTEDQKTDAPLTLYAATKKANEHMAHSYAHLWKIPTTMFRFFTVYGPWGRPDLALYKFAKAAFAGEAIDVYNHGRMSRDFTYIDDLVRGIRLLIDTPPVEPADPSDIAPGDTLSPVAPYRVVNIGNGEQVQLMEFITALEAELGFEIRKNMMEMQKGDVPGTWASSDLLESLTGYRPDTPVRAGIAKFVAWYRDYHGV
ncbi:MAG: NAD-dependent epimerase/dehydratase family protein [Jannaschia helgolandensis]|uniref:NAD-dependent epimerase/dehydratase family protein n=1 Tax=Jannaschia helgolandensis TaxID=188906 RepID=UPI003C790483